MGVISAPPCSIRLERVNGVRALVIRVTLHRIPEKHISLSIEQDRFKLNTLSFTRKFELDRAYPENVIIAVPDEPKAVLEYGILKLELPLVPNPSAKPKPASTKRSSIQQIKVAPIKMKVQKKRKISKAFPNKEGSLAILERINAEQEKDIQEKLIKDSDKHKAVEKSESEKLAKKERLETLKAAVKDDLKKSISKRKAIQADRHSFKTNKRSRN